MKRKIGFSFFGLLLIALALFTQPVNSYAQDNPNTPTEVSAQPVPPPELTKEQIYQDAKAALSQLGDVLAVGGEHVYSVLVKQQLVNSITFSCIFLFGFLLLIPVKMLRNKIEGESNPPDIYMILLITLGLLSFFMIVCSFVFMNTIITGFVNPEYGAIKEIMGIIK